MGIFASITALLLLWHSSYCPASICAAAAAAAATAGEGPSCTAPRPTSDALRPFCFIPRSTISTEAQKVLQERRVLPGGSLRDAPRDKVLAFQAEYNARTAPVSEAARRQHLQVCVCVFGAGEGFGEQHRNKELCHHRTRHCTATNPVTLTFTPRGAALRY